METQFDSALMAKLIKDKARKTNYRDLEQQIGVSKATLSRLGRGKTPDLETYFKVCSFLQVSTEFFRIEPKQSK